MEALQHGEMVVVTADAQGRLVGNPLTCREMLSSQVPCFDKLRWCIRILMIQVQQERNTKRETLQDVSFVDLVPPH